MHHFIFILGDGEELVAKLAFGVIVFVIWGISALSNMLKKSGQATPAPRRVTTAPGAMRRPAAALPPRRILAPPPGQPVVARAPVMVAAPLPPPVISASMFQQPPTPVLGEQTIGIRAELSVDPAMIDRLIWLEILGKPVAMRGEL